MKLDLKKPSIVLLGAWNPAIFSPSWIARNIFEYPEGQEVTIRELLNRDGISSSVVYIDDIGISASNHRVEIYANAHDNNQIETAENITVKIIETLPHTPLGAFGINLIFNEENPDASVLDRFITQEGLDQNFRIVGQNYKSVLQLDDCTLNFTREPSENNVTFDFNFHYNTIDSANFRAQITGKYSESLTRCAEILENHYGLDSYEPEGHEYPATETQ